MRRLKVGVIGTGIMGRNHVRNYATEKAYFELEGIYDSNYTTAKEVADKYNTRAYKDLDALLKNVEAVTIAVPSSLHKEVGIIVANHNVHALIEKPLALNSKDAEELSELFRNKNLKLAVGHIERFNPVITELSKLLDNSRIIFVETHRFGPFKGSERIVDADVIEDLMIHDIDLVCYLMQPHKVLRVDGMGEKVRTDVFDFASCILQFDSNAHAVISVSRVSQSKERTMSIHTDVSHIQADLLNKTLSVYKNTNLVTKGFHEETYQQDGVVQKIFVPLREPLKDELIAFYDSIVNNTPVAVDGSAGIKAIKIYEEVGIKAAIE